MERYYCNSCLFGLHTREEIDFLVQGLRAEIDDGLERLRRADAATDHVAWYRDKFEEELAHLRQALDDAGPPAGLAVAYHSIQASFLAGIWPLLSQNRKREAALASIRETNKLGKRTDVKESRKARCLQIARQMKNPTAERVKRKFASQFPSEKTPALRSIQTYLASDKIPR